MACLATPNCVTSNGNHGGSDDHQHIRLACQACQRKKIKCDRLFPCGQCLRSNLQCTPSTRKPRTRHGGKRAVDSELRNRISKLESLVESLSGEVGVSEGQTDGESRPNADRTQALREEDASSPAVGQYLGSPFWSSLTIEVQAIRDALEDEAEDEATDSTPSDATPGNGAPANSNDVDFFICPPGAVFVVPGALVEPSPRVQQLLHRAFLQNVIPMFKICHAPSLARFLQNGGPYLGNEATAPCNKAFRVVSWYAAINTWSDEECQRQLGQSREASMQQYRRMADVAMAQADLLNTNDLATLQALIFYMGALRMSDTGRKVWTLVGLAIRIARAMGLHLKAPGRTPYETQMRRRTWAELRFMDTFAAMDRGTEIVITPNTYDAPLPNYVNDNEFDEDSTSVPHHESGMTDMGFAMVAFEAVRAMVRLMTPEATPSGDTWQARLDFAHTFNKEIHDRYLQYCDLTIPFQRLIYHIGKSMSQGMILRAIRPIHRHVSSTPPRIDSPYVLKIAVDALSQNEKVYADPESQPWRWLVWVQWHPLSVALAGLCSIRGTELAEKAWAVVDRNFERQWRYVADSRQGMLWRPIEKLYKKAVAFREEGRRESLDVQRTLQTTVPQQQLLPQPKPTNPQLPQQGSPAWSPLFASPKPVQMQSPGLTSNPRLSPMTSTYAVNGQHHQQQPHMPTGPIPMDPLLSSSVDFSLPDVGTDGMSFSPNAGDISWLDWESIMTDLNQPVTNLGDFHQAPPQAPGGQGWGNGGGAFGAL